MVTVPGGRTDRFYPSSKTCSGCQTIKQDLTLKDRVFKCSICNNELDRDLNAAINLRQKAVSYTVSNACGEVKPPKTETFRTSMKQEENSNQTLNVYICVSFS